MKDIIEQLERATDRYELYAAFRLIDAAMDTSADFNWHLNRVTTSSSDTRALGYLMLAGLALVPAGWSWEVRSSGYGAAQACVWNPSKQPAPGYDIRVHLDNGTPAGAIAAAALRAREGS